MKNIKLAVFSILLSASGFAVAAASSTSNSGEIYMGLSQQSDPPAVGRVLLYKDNMICGSAQGQVTSGKSIYVQYGPGKAYCRNGVDAIHVNFGNQNARYRNDKLTPKPGGNCQVSLTLDGSTVVYYIFGSCYSLPH